MFSKREKGGKRSIQQQEDSPFKKQRKDNDNNNGEKKEKPKKENDYDKLKKEGKCFKCKEPWSPKGHKCYAKQAPIIGAAILDDTELDMEEWDQALESAVMELGIPPPDTPCDPDITVEYLDDEEDNQEPFVGMTQMDPETIHFDCL